MKMNRLNEIGEIVNQAYKKGVAEGRKQMEEKLVCASETGQPIVVNEQAWFVKSDLQNLRGIFAELENRSCEMAGNCQMEDIKQFLNDCGMDLLMTDKPRIEIADKLLSKLEELDK